MELLTMLVCHMKEKLATAEAGVLLLDNK